MDATTPHRHLPPADPSGADPRTDAVLAALDVAEADTLARTLDFLRIPSVSAQPAHAGDCRRAAAWLRDELAAIGFDAAVRETAGHPCVVARHPGPAAGAAAGAAAAPRVLYYGHHDVQPAEPLAAWSSPPFEPRLVEGPRGPRLVGRGAVDDKGQVMEWLSALRAWHAVAGGPPVPVTVLVEGEEEVGSPNLDAFLAANAAELRADVAVVSDTNMWDFDTPAITTRLRGMLYTEVLLSGGARDLHSGLYGGSAANPPRLLARILADLHDADGRVALPGFYDGVRDPPAATRAAWDALGFDEAAFLAGVGLSVPSGERGLGALDRLWARPTAECNGLWGGYAGEGAKTVIARACGAKVSFRLVPGQDPAAVADALRAHVAARLPADVSGEVRVLSAAPAVEVPEASPFVAAARAALREEFGREPVLVGGGGSIPVVESLRRVLGLDAVLMGFGLDDDGVHGPDEKFEWACLARGARAHARLLGRLAAGAGAGTPS